MGETFPEGAQIGRVEIGIHFFLMTERIGGELPIVVPGIDDQGIGKRTEKEHGKDALSFLIQTYRWNRPKYDGEEAIYEVNIQDLDRIFYLKYRELNYIEKLEIVIQTIYESSFGYGIVDRILTMNLDGVSAGVSKDILSL